MMQCEKCNLPKVSIIVPVYGVEKYIERCAASLFGQTLNELEYIFVDDCTPDRSIEVMQNTLARYPERCGQVRVIRHVENQGVSQSRQDGLDVATGEYIIHCDPDDWVELDMYESLYNEAQRTNADMVICDFKYSKSGSASVQCPDELTSISVLECITSRSRTIIHGAAWNKLLKAKIAKREKFPIGVSYCEDVTYWCKILSQELKIEYLNRSLYHYDYHPGTLCTVKSKEAIINDNKHIAIIESMKVGDNQRYDACLDSFIITVIFNRAFLSGLLSNSEFYKFYSPYRLCISSCSKRIIRFCIALSSIGLASQTLIIYKILVKVWQCIRCQR